MSNVSSAQHQAHQEKRRVAITSVVAALFLTFGKLAVGLWTNSLGILSEALHSGLDLVAASITLWAVRVSARPADRDHLYGHGKFENLSALVETVLLLLTCVWIVYEAARRLFFRGTVEINPNFWAFAVVIASIFIDIGRSRALRAAAIKHRSQALEADAIHFSTDIWSSCVVLLGLLAVLAAREYQLPWLVNADAVAALGVAVIVVGVGLRLGKKSVDDLLDRVPAQWHGDVTDAVAQVPGVEDVRRVRLRRSGGEIFADMTVAVGPEAPLEKAHEVASEAESAARQVLPHADVVVHVEPLALDKQDTLTKARVLAARRGLGAHGIRIYENGDERTLHLHLEVDQSLDLERAHEAVSEFEKELRAAVPNLGEVVAHIEPAGDRAATSQAEAGNEALVRRALEACVRELDMQIKLRSLTVQQVSGDFVVAVHCGLEAHTSITAVHEVTDRLERCMRARLPAIGRVIVRAEPA